MHVLLGAEYITTSGTLMQYCTCRHLAALIATAITVMCNYIITIINVV